MILFSSSLPSRSQYVRTSTSISHAYRGTPQQFLLSFCHNVLPCFPSPPTAVWRHFRSCPLFLFVLRWGPNLRSFCSPSGWLLLPADSPAQNCPSHRCGQIRKEGAEHKHGHHISRHILCCACRAFLSNPLSGEKHPQRSVPRSGLRTDLTKRTRKQWCFPT